jgi:hypothetical protein
MVAWSAQPEISKEELLDERFEDATEDVTEIIPENEFRDAAMRIVVQRNDFLLPNLLDMLVRHRSLEISPHYQRRTRWDNGRKSRLIESFLVNIPVPPVFLYENDFARYEVMDGQQRVAAIQDYFDNQFALTGLEILKSLQGKRYHELPSEVQLGLQRRSLSAIILLKESAPSAESESLLREHVFRRLNTGGVRLNAQEIRNTVFAGPFNDLLVELSRHPLFTEMWAIPPVLSDESAEPSAGLRRNSLYRTMRDVEYVLRVFALLDPENIAGGMKGTLDNAMKRYGENDPSDLFTLKSQFLIALELAHAMGGKHVFRIPGQGSKRGRISAPLFDGLMVALIRNLEFADEIRLCAGKIWAALQAEFENGKFYELVVGRANTKIATVDRAVYIGRLIESTIGR